MTVYETVRLKRAIRDFNDDPIDEATMLRILNAGRWSGSSKNNQPWHFVVIQDKVFLQALSECGQWAGHLAGATVGVALITADWQVRWPVAFDLGRAAQNMMLVAHEQGVGSVMANIYETERAARLLELPSDLMCYAAISFGYPQDPGELSRPPRLGRKRDITDVVHWHKW